MPSYKEIYKRPPISDRNFVLQFGKHRGKSIAFLMDAEPEYLVWCLENEIFSFSVSLQDEFEQMNPWINNWTAPPSQAKYYDEQSPQEYDECHPGNPMFYGNN
jgi:hypothetical protein